MENALTNSNILTIEQYVKKLVSKAMYHNDLPFEITDNPLIIRAEVEAGIRTFDKRGYDVIRKKFFVYQTIKSKNFKDEIIEQEECSRFDTFQQYYDYLGGDIYNNACYYQYCFTEDEISTYGIEIAKISNKALIDYTLSQKSRELDLEEKKAAKLVEKEKVKLLRWKDRFCACESIDDLISVSKDFDKTGSEEWELMLSSFALSNPNKNIPIVVHFLTSTKFTKQNDLLTMLCFLYNDSSIFVCFDAHYWKIRSEIMATLKMVNDGALIQECKKAYDSKRGLFYITKRLVDPNASIYASVKGRLTVWYDSFEAFAKALNNDLSNCILEDAPALDIDLSKYTINENTVLPLCSVVSPIYTVVKKYDYKLDRFVVTEMWRAAENSPVIKKREYKFKYFSDFVSFLSGDLSDADLVVCDGLNNIIDFSKINFEGALLGSTVKKRIGILSDEECIPLQHPVLFDKSDLNEAGSEFEAVVPYERFSSEQRIKWKKIYYISDLHLDHKIYLSNCHTSEDVIGVIKKLAIDITRGLFFSDILLIVGDTSCNLEYFKIFVKLLRQSTKAKIVFVLGNHELWPFSGSNVESIVSDYRDILDAEGIILLQNNIVYSSGEYSKLEIVTEEELEYSDISAIRSRLSSASFILFGGIGFSGLNSDFNADNGIYRNVISRKQEIAESEKFEGLYTKVRNALYDREVVVATHMPLIDWSRDVGHHVSYVYVSGHTHREEYYDDNNKRIYADNQIGYHRKNACAKYFYIEGKFDLFVDYADGIYEITREEYIDFYRGKNIRMTFSRDYDHLFMLKRDGYYCFILQTGKRLSILNGGATKIIKNKSIESCYDEMQAIIEFVKTPLDKFTSIQKQISEFVKSIGGEGRIHGAIIDIDFFNHIYVNPNDLKVTAYCATDIVNKHIYKSVERLLAAQRPDLINAYNRYLSGNSPMAITLADEADRYDAGQVYYPTDMYKSSNILKKMQRLYSNILTIWPEGGGGVRSLPPAKMIDDKH